MNGKHMTDLERFYMEKRLAECATQRAIAKELGVSPSRGLNHKPSKILSPRVQYGLSRLFWAPIAVDVGV